MKKFICSILAAVLLCLLPVTAHADTKGECSITVSVEYREEKITGGELIAVRVGYLDWNDQAFRQITDNAVIENIEDSSAVSKMLKYYNDFKNTTEFERHIEEVTDGIALFENLPEGLYLIYQEKPAAGYNNLAPFLVTLPYQTKDGVLLRDVTAGSKPELERTPVTPTDPASPTTPSGGKLPQTGQLTWPIPWMASGGMLLFALGWWLCFGRRKDPYEN